MDYPAFVPAAVREHADYMLPKLTELISQNGKAGSLVREYFSRQSDDGPYYRREFSNFLEEHEATILEMFHNRALLQSHKDALVRVVTDDRMREAYLLLSRVFTNDEQWHRMTWASASANLDYRSFRDRLDVAADICHDIGQASSYLSFLLQRVSHIGVSVPSFGRMSVLLNKDGDTYDSGLVPDIPWLSVEDFNAELSEVAFATSRKLKERKQSERSEFDWSIFEFNHNSPRNKIILAALEGRQNNKKTSYIRGLNYGLSHDNNGSLPNDVKKAMAVIATIVLDDPDIIVTYDDVRSALGQRGEKTLGKSRKKSAASSREVGKTASPDRK